MFRMPTTLRMPEMSKAQRTFLVFAILPVFLAFLLYVIQFPFDVQGYPFLPGVNEIWYTWHAYEHGWCYFLAAGVWFTVIWLQLADPSHEAAPTAAPRPRGEPPDVEEYFDRIAGDSSHTNEEAVR